MSDTTSPSALEGTRAPRLKLESLPENIIEKIYSNLRAKDRLSFLQTCSTIFDKIPAIQTNSIILSFSGIDEWNESDLRDMPEDGGQAVEHVIIDFTLPGLGYISKQDMKKMVEGYPESVRLKISEFCQDFEAKNPDFPLESGINFVTQVNSATEISRLTSTLSSIISRKSDSWETPRTRTRTLILEGYRYRSIVKLFKHFPNLRILEFRNSDLSPDHPRNKDYLAKVWEHRNPGLKTLLTENPKLNDLPWEDWWQWEGQTNYNKLLAAAYPCIIAATVLSGAKPLQVRLNAKVWLNEGDELPNWRFDTFVIPVPPEERIYYPPPHISGSMSVQSLVGMFCTPPLPSAEKLAEDIDDFFKRTGKDWGVLGMLHYEIPEGWEGSRSEKEASVNPVS
ncbi:hypothetical protein TWF730_007099 [Orbilia blumenaviensis]|uniref:F-box domain-containing protein n=1 Tax=Orbilia blumenaviensis TaxID=1796055 RepID=A0AAV9VGJ9_9PEZI